MDKPKKTEDSKIKNNPGDINPGKKSNKKSASQTSPFTQNQRYYYLYQHATDGLFILNYDGYFRDPNKMCERITGYSKKKLEKIHFSDLLAAKEKRFICYYFELIKKRQLIPREEIQIEILAKNNTPKVVDLHILNAIFEEGLIQASIRDVTEKKKLQELLINSQRMECLGKLVNEVSHKFNDILTAILGSSSYLRPAFGEEEEAFKYIEAIHKSASMGVDLVSQLMAFGSGQKFHPRLIDINIVVKETIKLMHSKHLLNRIEVVSDIPEDPLPIQIDKHQIMHALMNICHNAKDAMEKGGLLTISTKKVNINDDFSLQNIGLRDGYYINVRITDTGMGIEEKTLPYIFDPFFTTKDVGKGQGLGLSVAYGIFKAHQGTIIAKSAIRQGTVFDIFLPAPSRSSTSSSKFIMRGEGTIMVVEDEELVRRITINILERSGFKVICAEDGEEALELFKEKGDSIDLIILDVIMPRMDGMETFKELKILKKDIRVLVSTGYLPNNMSTEFLKGGALGFIQKPYTAMELLKSVSKIIN